MARGILRRLVLLVTVTLPLAAQAHDDYPFAFLKPKLSHEQFIGQSFRGVLGRAPSARELEDWDAVLDRGSSRWYLFSSLLDSEAYARQATAEESVVLAFQAAVLRAPTQEELAAFAGWLREGGKRSGVLRALMMSRELARLGISPFELMDDIELRLHPSLVPDLASLIEEARTGAAAPFVEPVAPPPSPLRRSRQAVASASLASVSGHAVRSAYGDYRGFLHAHSYLSVDARNKGGTPTEAWTMARDQAGLDFMGITDHAEFLGETRWQQLRAEAAPFVQPGRFIALPGFEHSNPVMGHYCVMNTTDFVSALQKVTVNAFYDWLEQRPHAVVTFNHPGSYDFLNIEFNHFALRPSLIDTVVATETMHSSLDQYAVGYGGEMSFYDEALLRGWRVGSVQAQDNHSPDYGIKNDTRTVVFAEELTTEGILDAYRKRRVYASEDRNLYLTFSTADGHEMGSILDRGPRTFLVGFDDPDSEPFTRIDVYQNGHVTHTQSVATTSGTWAFDVPAADQDRHYYVQVTQADGDRAQSSPIWLTAAATGTVAIR
jgi:hypothetical protein